MNKYKEAFDLMYGHLDEKDTFYLCEEFSLLEELVERATPKKVIRLQEKSNFINQKWLEGYCPNCHSFLQNTTTSNNCSPCGQALDWSND